jgi:hypothetical protein
MTLKTTRLLINCIFAQIRKMKHVSYHAENGVQNNTTKAETKQTYHCVAWLQPQEAHPLHTRILAP